MRTIKQANRAAGPLRPGTDVPAATRIAKRGAPMRRASFATQPGACVCPRQVITAPARTAGNFVKGA